MTAPAFAPWVVLCGAGISVAPPSSVPSWWGFNQAVLTELRLRFLGAHVAPVRAERALQRLSLDRLDVAEFSQIVSDAFAGDTWFDSLEALDGHEPNANHYVLAQWALEGSLRTIITTSFDTMIERALHARNTACRVYNALIDRAPIHTHDDDTVVVVKLHGTISRHDSLIDLASQKRRGQPGDWQSLLENTFSKSNVAVAGFSGSDLALGDDYLRLKAAAAAIPSLRWLHRPGQRPSEEAREVVSLGVARFQFVAGDLPDGWRRLGVPDPVISQVPVWLDTRTRIPDDAKPEVAAAIAQWLDYPMVDADTCGIALTRLLSEAGSLSAAQALRT